MMLGAWMVACPWPGPSVPEGDPTAVAGPTPDAPDWNELHGGRMRTEI